jgi:uncharacterized protein (DUF1330 family)
MRRLLSLPGLRLVAVIGGAAIFATVLLRSSFAQQEERPALLIVERTETIGAESIQEEYAKLARDILPKFGARYLARSQKNELLEGNGPAPCCIAIIEFPNLDAARRWYASPENQAAAKIRQSGARFKLIAVEGLPAGK